MEREAIDNIRQALAAARAAAHEAGLDTCDMQDIEEVLAPTEAELNQDRPNVQTLATYLNSLARSLRSNVAARSAVMQLDAAMREAGVPTHWEH